MCFCLVHESDLFSSLSATILVAIAIANAIAIGFFFKRKEMVEGSTATAGAFVFVSSKLDFDSLGREETGTYFSMTFGMCFLRKYFVEFTPLGFFLEVLFLLVGSF